MLFVFKSVAIVFPLLVDVSFILHLQQLVSGMTQFYFTGVDLEFLEDRGEQREQRENRERQRQNKIGTNSRVHFYWPTTIENS